MRWRARGAVSARGSCGSQPRIGNTIFAVIITDDMGVSRIDAADGPVEHLGTDREGTRGRRHATGHAGCPSGSAHASSASPGRGRAAGTGRAPRCPSSVTTWAYVRPFLATWPVTVRCPSRKVTRSATCTCWAGGECLCAITALPRMRVITRTMGEPIHHIPRLPTGVYGRLRAPDHHPCTRRRAAGSPHTPRHQDVRAARRACAWPPCRLRCSVASWPGWYGPRVPARPGDSPRPGRLCARHA